MAMTEIQKVRIAVADLDPAMPLLADDTYQYFLDKNNANVNKASIDAAKTILLMLAQRTAYTVDIFSVSNTHRSADQYRQALELFLRDPNLNPVLQNVQGYFGGIRHTDILGNHSVLDNNVVSTPNTKLPLTYPNGFTI